MLLISNWRLTNAAPTSWRRKWRIGWRIASAAFVTKRSSSIPRSFSHWPTSNNVLPITKIKIMQLERKLVIYFSILKIFHKNEKIFVSAYRVDWFHRGLSPRRSNSSRAASGDYGDQLPYNVSTCRKYTLHRSGLQNFHRIFMEIWSAVFIMFNFDWFLDLGGFFSRSFGKLILPRKGLRTFSTLRRIMAVRSSVVSNSSNNLVTLLSIAVVCPWETPKRSSVRWTPRDMHSMQLRMNFRTSIPFSLPSPYKKVSIFSSKIFLCKTSITMGLSAQVRQSSPYYGGRHR